MEAFLEDGYCVREGKWTQSIAIGSEGFVEKTRQELSIRARGRKVVEAEPAYQLRKPQVSYSAHIGLENDDIGAEIPWPDPNPQSPNRHKTRKALRQYFSVEDAF